MKKIHGLLSVAGLLMMAASVSAGWGSSGGGFGSGGGYSTGHGSSGGYSAGYGSSGGGYSAGGGSSGGYAAGYGSSGGASAGYGSSGGVAHVGPLRRLASHIHSHHANRVALRASAGSSGGGSSGGSSGGYHSVSHGSSGGGYSPVSHGSSGGYGSGGSHHGSSGGGFSHGGGSSGGYSHASYGSTGGSYYGSTAVESYGSVGSSHSSGVIYDSGVNYSDSAPMYSSPSTYAAPMVEGPMSQPAPMHSGALDGSGWSNRLIASSKPVVDADQIQLNVVLPESATVFVNGNRTKSTGALRRFVSKDLEAGQSYRFEVRAEREVDGRTVTEQKTIVLVPGSSESIEFALEEKSKAAETVLTLNVPQDAKVVLAGNGTKSLGETRTFRSNELAPGQVWDDYKITVTWNGQVKEKTIRLIGGDELQVSFNFEDSNKIAMR